MHDDGPGGEPEALEEVLHRSITGQGDGIDAAATPISAPLEHRAHDDIAHADLACLGLDIDVVEHGEIGAVGEPLDVQRGVTHHHIVVLADDHTLRSIEQPVASMPDRTAFDVPFRIA